MNYFFGCFTGRTNRVRRQSGSGLENGTALCPGGMDLSEASEACSEPKLDCKTEYTCGKIVKCRNVTRETTNVRDRRLRIGRMLRLFNRRGYMGFHHRLRHRRFRRDSRSLSRRSVICRNVHITRKVTVCCKYICSKAENSDNEGAEIFERRHIRFG